MFHEKNLKPSTISHYRSALALPLKLKFDIDLRVQEISQMLRAMYLQRPKTVSTAPSWKLSTVLEFLEKATEIPSETSSLRKAAFLLLLATGWRISELHACVRDKEYCMFRENSTLVIRPHPSFLAKNEGKKRMQFREIKPLLEEGTETPSKLCPVSALKEYLDLTKHANTGKLFLNTNASNTQLTVQQLGAHVRSLIKMADPLCKVSVHEVRKYSASYSFAESMVVGDLVSTFQWSSPAVFYRHYFTQPETLSRPVKLPTH